MTDGGAARESIDVVQGPAELVHQRCHEQRRIGDATREDDVGATRKRGQHGFRAKVCIGRHDGTERRQRGARLHRGRRQIERVEYVVAGDRGDLDGQLQSSRDVDDGIRRRERVCGAEVAHELDAIAHERREQRFDALVQSRVVAGGRIAPAAQLGQRDRALGKALEDQIIELAALCKIHGRIETIAREAGAAAESHSLHRPLLIRVQCPPS